MTTDNDNAYGEALYRRWLRGDKEWMDFHSGEDWIAFTRAHHEHSLKSNALGQAQRPAPDEDGLDERGDHHEQQQG